MILVTGATGLVGSHLCYHLLSHGKAVLALAHSEKGKARTKEIFGFYENPDLFHKLEWEDADITDVMRLEEIFRQRKISEIYHCAGLVSYETKDEKKMFQVNSGGTANLVNQALFHGANKFCHVSSVAAIGIEKEGKEVTEYTKWNASGATNYAISKNSAEREAWRGAEEGLNVVIVNPSVIIGPGAWETSSAKLLMVAKEGTKFYTEGSTGIVDVRDVVNCMYQLMEREIFSERFILNGENLSFRNLLSIPMRCFKKPQPSLKISKNIFRIFFFLERITCVFTGKKPRLSGDFLKSGFGKTRYSSEKIKTLLDIKFVSAEESFGWACDFMRK